MKTFPNITRTDIPELSTAQMIEVDRAMIEDYGITLIQMMENAGRCLAIVARDQFLGGATEGKRVVVLAGRGGNGGGAIVAARRLAAWGCDVQVALTRAADSYAGIPEHQLKILLAMGVPVEQKTPDSEDADLILDGVIGYSLSGAPSGTAAELIEWANKQSAPVLSLDAPSGLDTSSGIAYTPSITAAATMTLALPKQGLQHDNIGDLFLADISVPPELYSRFLGIDVPRIFAQSDIVRLA